MCNHYLLANAAAVVDHVSSWDDDQVTNPDIPDAIGEAVFEEAWPWKNNTLLPVAYAFEGRGKIGFMRWGTPNYVNPRQGWVSNARDDRLLSSPTWKRLVKSRRCLIGADGFFEFFGPTGAKREALFRLPAEDPFVFAGLWDIDPKDKKPCFAIVTGRPNATVAALPHDRMPVIFTDRDRANAWLGGEPISETEVARLCEPFAGKLVRVDQPLVERIPKSKVTKADLVAGENGELFGDQN